MARAEIDQTAVPGGIFGEIVFFHKDSKTLILADTIINLELDKIRQPWRFAAKLTGMYYPRGQIFFGMRLPLILQKRKTRAAVQQMLSWQPERIILSHGRWFDANASATLQRLFGWALYIIACPRMARPYIAARRDEEGAADRDGLSCSKRPCRSLG